MRRTGSTATTIRTMRALNAHRVIVSDRGGDAVQGGRAGQGTYTGHHRSPVDSGIPCPYCKGPMIEARPTEIPKRILRVVRRYKRAQNALVWAHAIPETHKIVACRACRAVFTLPKSMESAMSAAAVDPHATSTGKPSTRD